MVSKTRTQAFSGGFCAEKSVESVKDLSKLSSTLLHLFTTSDWAIGSEDILVGSSMPSYLKAGCFRSWRGCVRRLINEKTTWSSVTHFFLIMATARRMASTCLPPALLDLGGTSSPFWKCGFKVPNMELEFLPFGSLTRFSGHSTNSHPPTTAGLVALGIGTRKKKCWKRMEMGENSKECLIEMSENWKMQDGLGSEMV